eukprot:Gb_40733 [translate_table: standard]
MRNHARNRNLSRSAEQMCYQDTQVYLSAEETAAAEESLSIYCKPVELYNILQRRALRHPLFLQRCLHYKIQAKRQRRIKMTVTFSGFVNGEVHGQNIWPLFVLVSSPILDSVGDSAAYRLSRTYLLKGSTQPGCNEQSAVSFILPEIGKLSEDVVTHNLTILFVSCVDPKSVWSGRNLQICPLANYNGQVLWGKLAMGSLCSSWEKSPSLKLGHRADMISAVDLHSSILEHDVLEEGSCIIFRTPSNSNGVNSAIRLQVNISAQELGPREKSPYDSYSYSDIPSSSLFHIIRLRTGNVIFNYRYYNNSLHKTEVTEDFSCPFCLVRCASFKGLRLHLSSSHDLFNFEFWVTEEYQAVNVSVKNEIWRSEGNIPDVDGSDPRFKTFFFCSRSSPLKRRRIAVNDAVYIHHHVEKSETPETRASPTKMALTKNTAMSTLETSVGTLSKEPSSAIFVHSQPPVIIKSEKQIPSVEEQASHIAQSLPTKTSKSQLDDDVKDDCKEEREKLGMIANGEMTLPSERHQTESSAVEQARAGDTLAIGTQGPVETGVCLAAAVTSGTSECGPQTSASNLIPSPRLRFGKTRRLSIERTEPRNRALLQKRQFFHSHRAQAMALEQVLSDRDSEDEVDDDIADFEDRRMLDDFVDVTKHEKQVMHLWNSFVRKQRVLADGHIPWACEAFSQQHGQDLSRIRALQWCWRLFMVKLWNHSLLDAATMNRCNMILENFSKNQ